MSKNDGISGLVNDKLDKNNFHAWKFRMTNFLMGKGYWDYIDGNQEEMPDLPDVNPTAEQIKAFKDWNQGARKVMYWLSVSVQDTMIGHIQDATSPKQAWDRLVSVDTTNTKARKIQLKNELNTVKKENLSINDYTLKIKGIVESLASIGVQVEDDDKVEDFEDAIEDAVDIQVETKYKTIAKKVKPMATPLPEGSNEVIEEASRHPTLSDPKNIGDKFTEHLYSILDSIRSHVRKGFSYIGVHGSTQGSNVVKHNLEEKPIQIPRRPDLSRGHVKANKEKPIQMLRPLLSSLNLEEKEGRKEEGQSSLQLESKEDAGDSYNEDECKRFALSHQKELLSSEHNNNNYQNEDSSDGDSIPHGKANGSDSLPQGKAISKKQNAQRMLYKQKKKSKQDGEKDAPISLDFEDSKELSMQDLDSTEVEKEANLGGEEETRLHEYQERIRGDLIVARYTLDEALKALNTRAKVHEHEVIATFVEPTTKTTV
ncbi:hypothetical protein L7F22_052303 [Adiantum nelumboides]|nr:hypothetical protein [Adiantum nelumboides]